MGLLVLPNPPPWLPPTGPLSGCFTFRASMYSCTTAPASPSAVGMVFNRFRSRRLNCMTSCFSLFSLSSCVPLTVPLLGLSLLLTQLAMPASGGSRQAFAYIAVKSALCACSRAGVVRMRDKECESSSWFKLPSKKKDSAFLYVVQSASLMALFTAVYSGSTSTRGVRGALGFLPRSVWRLRPGKALLERAGDMFNPFMAPGAIVPAIVAVRMRLQALNIADGRVVACRGADQCACGESLRSSEERRVTGAGFGADIDVYQVDRCGRR
jgi:hypothetical protein